MVNQDLKLPLPKFLKILTGNGIVVSKAMAVAGKIYKEYNTPAKLSELTDTKLSMAGVSDKEDRKLVLSAFRKAGYVYKGRDVTKEAIEATPPGGAPKTIESHSKALPYKRKRKQSSEKNEFLPDGSHEEGIDTGNFEFSEILDEQMLQKKSCVINRAPVMMAWAMVVAERLGFKRAEALSIASVYTELNAVSKGISLGVFEEGKGKNMEASSGMQPYVDLMGRRIPLYKTQEGRWRALSSGKPIFPSAAFSYISRSFKQTTPHIMGALQLLAADYPPDVLNTEGWSLYTNFRPQVDGWGKRSEVKCATVLSLRRNDAVSGNGPMDVVSGAAQPVIKKEEVVDNKSPVGTGRPGKPKAKKARVISNKYEATLDSDTTLDNVFLESPAREGNI